MIDDRMSYYVVLIHWIITTIVLRIRQVIIRVLLMSISYVICCNLNFAEIEFTVYDRFVKLK